MHKEKRKMKVCFIQDGSFLRTAEKTNPFFDPIIKVCEQSGMDWRVGFRGMPKACGYQKGKVFSFKLFLFWEIWAWHIAKCFGAKASWKVQVAFANMWKRVFGGIVDADIYITIAGNMIYELAAMYPNKRVIDLQHGVIYSGHQGYFLKDARLTDRRCVFSNIEFWVFGKGYADCFFKNPENAKDLEGRVKIIGDVVRANARSVEGRVMNVEGAAGEERNLVVMSLQLTDDLDQEEKAGSVKVMEAFFGEFFKKYGDKYTVLFKHHPRFNNCYDLSDFYKKFPQIKESKASWDELYPKMAMHITFASTSTFDCAANGIPTLLLNYPHKRAINRAYWEYDFNYPLFNYSMDEILSDFNKCSIIVSKWYSECYEPFDEKKCLKLLKGEN